MDKIIVFNGNNEENRDMFSEEELKYISEENLFFSPAQIHKDDSVEQIKRKIVNELGYCIDFYSSKNCEKVATPPNYAELHLFAYKTRTINLLNALSSSTKSVVDRKIFREFVRNLDLDDFPLDKEIYGYKYLTSLGFNKEQRLSIKTSLGMEFKHGYNYLLSPNPFLTDLTVETEKIKTSIYMNETKLLGEIDDNNIYVCLARDVLADDNDSYSQIYFPHLFEKGIRNLADLDDAQSELKEDTDAKMNEKEFATYEKIDKLYEIHYDDSVSLANAKHGINSFSIEVKPTYTVVMPLDAIFKNLHCDAEFPFVKYNPGVRRENIYRLYSITISKNGKKIPYLPKKKIENLVRTTSNHKQISVYNAIHKLIISIESDGIVKINGKFKEDDVKTIAQIETIIKSSVNPVVEKINSYLRNSGYRISTIESLKDENVKIANMNYHYSVAKIAKMDLKNACIYPVFSVVQSNVKKGAVLRFVRVDNFQKMNFIASFIIDMYKKREDPADAYNALVAQQGFELIDAKKMVAKVLNDSNNVSQNPGLITTMKLDDNVLKVIVNNVDNISYVETLGIYLDSIVKITQEMVDVSDVCAKEEKEEIEEKEELEEGVVDVRDLFLKEENEDDVSLDNESLDNDSSFDIASDVESDDDSSQSGGDKSEEEDVKGKKYFLKRLTKSDPVLFKEINKKNGKLQRYTRMCHSMQQPVVVSDEEKTQIDEKYRDSYEHAIPSENKKNWYVCPQFWCFQTNMPMSQADIDAGKCGPPSEVKKNAFEFTDKDHKKANGSYHKFNPGFLKDSCMPCCFKEWNSEMHKERRKKCLPEDKATPTDKAKPTDKAPSEATEPIDKAKPTDKATTPTDKATPTHNLDSEQSNIDKSERTNKREPPIKAKPTQNTSDIMGHNTSLIPGRWGYLPDSIRRFMQIKYNEKDQFLFLRYGVEQSQTQSLVGCLADIYGKMHKKQTPTIAEMRKILVDSISLADFKKYGKGSFTKLFSQTLEESYEKFCKYLLDEKSNIDHTYLWNIISTPNKQLFESGLNMVIMEIVNNDITDKVDLVCPSTSYVKTRFDKNRDTIFLINNGARYEPVYLANKDEKTKKIKSPKPYFNLFTTAKIPNIHKLLNQLDNTLNQNCETSRKDVREYTFKPPMELNDLVAQIGETKGYTIAKQVLNYQERTIALWVKTPSNNHMVIPCEPSEQYDYPIVYMDEHALWSDYETTLDELMELKTVNPQILCEPVVKMMDKGLVVGVLTETNQFIKFSEPKEVSENDGLSQRRIAGPKQNPYEIELAIDKSKTEDPERIRIVRNIMLESNFFAVYRATIKSLLEDTDKRKEVVDVIDDPDFSYREKLEKVKTLIANFTEDVVVYTKMSESVMSNISYKCGKDENSGLYVDGCTLAVPKKNLVSKKDNSVLYSYRVADEIVRYGRIQNFVLNANQFLNIGNAEYKINADEYIISESVLSANDYFDDMINKDTNEYRPFNAINGIPYDMAKTHLYLPRMVELQKPVVEKAAPVAVVGCSIVEKFRDQTKQQYWGNNVFPANTMKIVFKDTAECSFEPLIYIMKQMNNKIYGIQELKEMIYTAYSEYIGKHKEKIIYLLSKQGKRALFKSKMDFETIVKGEGYFMTTLDLWVFAQKYNVPIILFSSKNVLHDVLIIQGEKVGEKDYIADLGSIKNTGFNNSWIILGADKGPDSRFFFFESVSEIRDKPKISSHVLIQKQFFRTELNDLDQRIHDVFEQDKAFSLEEYLNKRTK